MVSMVIVHGELKWLAASTDQNLPPGQGMGVGIGVGYGVGTGVGIIGVGGFARAIRCCVGAGVGACVGDSVVGAGVGAAVGQCVAVQCAQRLTAPMKSEQQTGHHECTEQW